MPPAQTEGPTAWIVVSPDTAPLVSAHLEHPGGAGVGATHEGDDWTDELRRLRRRLAELEASAQGTGLAWTMYAPPRPGAVRQVRGGAGGLHRLAAFGAAVTGGTVERAAVHGRSAGCATAAPRSSRRPPASPWSRTPRATGHCSSSAVPTRRPTPTAAELPAARRRRGGRCGGRPP